MATKVWTIELDGAQHTIRLEHAYWSGRRLLQLDGETLVNIARQWPDTGSRHKFAIGEHQGVVYIRRNLLTFEYDLAVDGLDTRTGLSVVQRPISMPQDLRTRGWWLLFWAAVNLFSNGNLLFAILAGSVGALAAFVHKRWLYLPVGWVYIAAGLVNLLFSRQALWMIVGLIMIYSGARTMMLYRRFDPNRPADE